MKRLGIITALFGLVAVPSMVHAEFIQAKLIGFQEVPSVSTVAGGEFRARINPGD
jgi:hypothetical protein